MIHVLLNDLHGNEELTRLKLSVGDKGLQELNVTVLDGQKITADELRAACDAVPFLADRRLVVVRRLLARAEARPAGSSASRRSEVVNAFANYLPHMPMTTDLVLVEDVPPSANNPLFIAIKKLGASVAEIRPLQGEDLVDWIVERVRQKGGKIKRAAANELAIYVGQNLWLLDKEIEKLVTYAGSAEISSSDVATMVSYAREASVFALLDAIGQGDVRGALRKLRELLAEGEAPAYLLVMVTRQVRLMLLAKELTMAGMSPEAIGNELRLHRYPRDKILQQIRRFTLGQLESAYDKLLSFDTAVKTGRMSPLTALDLLTIELTYPTTGG